MTNVVAEIIEAEVSFQSTCHIRGMTAGHFLPFTLKAFQSTCHIRGMTQIALLLVGVGDKISIHMPHTWHDSTPLRIWSGISISIHMPHTWHDVAQQRKKLIVRHFNPHATYVA